MTTEADLSGTRMWKESGFFAKLKLLSPYLVVRTECKIGNGWFFRTTGVLGAAGFDS